MSISFGAAVKALRGRRSRPSLAPGDYTAQQRRDFGNYLGRIESDRVKPGLDTLRLISAGLGYYTLGFFFFAIEQAQRGTVPGVKSTPIRHICDLDVAYDMAHVELSELLGYTRQRLAAWAREREQP